MRLVALALVLVAALSACTMQLEVAVVVDEDGSGTVSAGVGLDADARTQFPELSEVLVTSDLVDAGWDVGAPQVLDDGREWVVATKEFGSADQLQVVLDEVFGSASGVFDGFEITRASTGSEQRFAVDGTVDLTEGMALFSDASLAEVLGSEPLGDALSELAPDFDDDPTDAVSMQMVIDLPMRAEQVVDLPLGESTVIRAEAVEENRAAQLLGWVKWALAGLLALSLVLAGVNYLLDLRYERARPDRGPSRVRSRVPKGTSTPAAAAAPARPQMQMMVLDVHDVLFRASADPRERVVSFVQQRGSSLTEDEIVELHRQATLGRMRAATFWESCGVAGDPDSLDAALLADVRLRHGAKEFLREMHRRGVPVAVVTNDLADWSHKLRDLHGLTGIAPWVVSSEIGVRKPDPAAFEALRRMTGIPYFSMVIVDGQIPSLDTAQSLGLMTAWFARERPGEGADPGHSVITKFADFFRRRTAAQPVR